MKFWTKKNEHQITENEAEVRQEEIGTELSDDLMGQIAGGLGKGACHTSDTAI